MVMLKIETCRAISAGQPDLSSTAFRNAVSTARARVKSCKSEPGMSEAREVLAALLAHGEPVAPSKRSEEELSQIRRMAGHSARRATCKAALRRKLADAKDGYVSVTDRKPAVFDAALEMIEDGEVACVYQTVQTVYPGPISEEGRAEIRRITLARPLAEGPHGMTATACRWSSLRRQQAEEERI